METVKIVSKETSQALINVINHHHGDSHSIEWTYKC